MRVTKRFAGVFVFLIIVSAEAVQIVTDLGQKAELGVTEGYGGGLDPASWVVDYASTNFTFVYDISGLGVGAESLEIFVNSLNGETLTGGGQNGIAVNGGTSALWWELGEDLAFDVVIRDATSEDVTSDFLIDLTGVCLRWVVAGTATISGTTVTNTLGSMVPIDLPDGETNEVSFTAARLEAGMAQFAQLQFDIVNPNASIVVDADYLNDSYQSNGSFEFDENGDQIAANVEDSLGFWQGGTNVVSSLSGISKDIEKSYTTAGATDGSISLEIGARNADGALNRGSVLNTKYKVQFSDSGMFNLSFDFFNASGWDADDTVEVALFTSDNNTVGTALGTGTLTEIWSGSFTKGVSTASWTNIVLAGIGSVESASVGKELFIAFSSGTAVGGEIARIDNVQLSVLPSPPMPVVANFGTDSSLNTQGFSDGVAPSALPDGTTTNYAYSFDISNRGLGGAATLEVDMVSQNGATVRTGGPFGVTVTGGGNDLWWDAGEGFDFAVRVLDASNKDITSFFTVDLTGFSVRWRDANGDANDSTKVTATVAGESFDAPATTAVAILPYSLAEGDVAETSFSAFRTGTNDVCQLAQLKVMIALKDSVPVPFAVLGEPFSLMINGDFTSVANPTPDDGGPAWPVAGSLSDWYGYYGRSAEVVGWSHYYDDPNNLASEIGTVNADDDNSIYTLDGTDKLSTGINITSGLITLNSSMGYRNGMMQSLDGITINPDLTYVFSVDAFLNPSDPKDNDSTTFSAAIISGADGSNWEDAVSSSVIQLSATNLPDAEGVDVQTVTVNGSDLAGGPLHVVFESVNTEAIPSFPNVSSSDVNNADNVSQLFVGTVSLTFIPLAGDLNRDGFITQDDVSLATMYLAGNGGDDAAARQNAMIELGYSAAEALDYLNLSDFDVDGNNVFDSDDVAALDLLARPFVQASMNGGIMDLSWNGVPGKVYDVESCTNLPVSEDARYFRVIER
ncbi:hypothetical protein [Tichowtungia aerotolerans]|uniref:Dockerin domain-containing protein n=1 Tax=Tichowtungia aerotolerans TaxID=2697043 RepID=A0A6P1M5U0_9BACT|nr:hypothetical protein [Tichowtungia aerotolerans]QHI69950.1 hypothetical protein GT409_10965 [Tichowtungia aerotolerans]